jgi:1,4-alpha-glucan branching enzyme
VLKRANPEPTVTRLTFVLPSDAVSGKVSVVGDFNGWIPDVHQLKKRSNGTHSVNVDVAKGKTYEFKYLGENGSWFCDPDADTRRNEYGETNSVVDA